MNTPLLFQDNIDNNNSYYTDNQKEKSFNSEDYLPFDELLGRTIKGWVCKEIIGKGTFGVIYKCIKTQTEENYKKNKKFIGALKAEDQTKQDTHIVKEVNVLEALKKTKNGKYYFPEVLDYGEKQKFKFVITTLCGSNLFDILIKMPNQIIEIKTWIRVVINVLEGLKILHSKGIIHLDLKPANIIVDYQYKRKHKNVVVKLIDFGLAKYLNYTNNINELPINLDSNVSTIPFDDPIWIGSIFYCSPYIHQGYEPSYRDDVYSWLYVSMDLYKELPWDPDDTEINIIKKKFNTTCGIYKNYFPVELEPIIRSIVEGSLNKPPDYNGILKKLKNFMKIHLISWDEPCQWESIFNN
uniref:non-specific serine/threonine protein kinase n=1 Tax=Strongyloides stercoralis TaxID=6248 RepID=A0A0K0DSU5_STRER